MNSNQKLNKSKVGGNFGTVLFGACPRQFPEKRIEVLRVLKSQAVTDLVDPPVAIPQQAHGFRKHTFPDELGSGFAGLQFYTVVEMIDVYVQQVCKTGRGFGLQGSHR